MSAQRIPGRWTPPQRMVWRVVSALLVVLAWMALSAHVGTNQVVLEGQAGGYQIRVMIDPPGVVPAQVPIVVRVLNGTPTRVTVRAAQWNVGTRGAPPAEEAALVRGDPGAYAHQLWIMTASTYAVHVAVEGPAGNGELIVPMQTASTRTLGMQRVMGGVLLVLGISLVVGLITIVGAAAREATLTAGESPSPTRRRTARVSAGVTAGVLALLLFGGARWWSAEEAAYKARMFRPIANEGGVHVADGARVLTLSITDSLWRTNRYSPLMPDHGKLMHLFLVRIGDADVIAHLHPLRVSADSFVTSLPPVPEGRYVLFGDLLLQSGATRTLVDTVDVPAEQVITNAMSQVDDPRAPALDPDDSWRETSAVALGLPAALAGGGTLTLTADATVQESRDLRLTATVVDSNGDASAIEPYMGMLGHAMVYRRDGGLFMHLHPMGTASMTAQAQLERRERGDTSFLDSAAIANAATQVEAEAAGPYAHAGHGGGVLSFPFAFPTAGDYRVFVQVKRNGVVETAAFDLQVPARAK